MGWIGRNRMQALADADLAQLVAVADPDPQLREQALAVAPGARGLHGLDELLSLELDGVVIATPSALHAEQSRIALEHGLAVFCQKPLGRDLAECESVLTAARTADRLLGVDLSYRHIAAIRAAHSRARTGELGRIYAADLTFHNAYGPDKPWFTRRSQSGGGCLIDLGTHLIDLALWLTAATEATITSASLLNDGRPLQHDSEQVEDFALAHLRLNSGVEVRLACSWFLPAGRDCVIELALYGTEGAAAVRNVGGSFYDFRAERWQGTRTEVIAEPPDDWSGRALTQWAGRLAGGPEFDPSAEEYLATAGVLEEIYRAAR